MDPKTNFFVLPEEEEKDTRPREDHLAYIFGYVDKTVRPEGTLSRAEAEAFLNRVFNRVADDVAIQGFEGSIKKFTDLDIRSWWYYELVEATNSHELVRRNGKDAMDRAFEDWTRLLNQ